MQVEMASTWLGEMIYYRGCLILPGYLKSTTGKHMVLRR